MSTRTIVTSQPDVACDVCERRLLRGEQPEVFLAAGRRLTVCELCAPRATDEGWLRETDTPSVALPPMRPRRGRGLFERLRAVGRPPLAAEALLEEPPQQPRADGYDLLDATAGPVPARGRLRRRGSAADALEGPQERIGEEGEQHDDEPQPRSYVEQALDAFNASEFPRRVAGVARSLGAPEVSARSAEHLSSVIVIVVAWELCWYRYEVDLSEGLCEVRVLAQGTELSELPRDDRLANAAAGEDGVLALTRA